MSDSQPERVLVVDDHPLFRKGVADLLAVAEELLLVGEAASGEEGLVLAQELGPDLVLLDINMKGMSGVETVQAMRDAGLDCRIIMLTVSDAEKDVVAALRAGADGYLLKDMEPEETLAALRTALSGRTVISERLVHLIAEALGGEHRTPSGADDVALTGRELEILRLIATGLSNKVIGAELDISEGTVKVHVKNLLRKLNVRSRVEAAVWALTKGGLA